MLCSARPTPANSHICCVPMTEHSGPGLGWVQGVQAAQGVQGLPEPPALKEHLPAWQTVPHRSHGKAAC